MKVEIKSWFDGKVMFTAELSAQYEDYSVSLQLGAAVKAAYKAGADLRGADLRGAALTGAYLRGADLSGADLRGALINGVVQGVDKHATPEESVANLDKVREIILDNEAKLNMSGWHEDSGWINRSCAEEAVCGTTHCLAGWLQVCSTDPKVRGMDPHLAGIVTAPVAAKMFFREAPEVLEWLREKKYAEEAKERA